MRILLGSGGYRTEERIGRFRARLIAHLGPIERVLFIPYALRDHDGYVKTLTDRGINAGYELVGIHRFPDPHLAIAEADAIFVGGGNTFRLLNTLQQLDLLEPIRQRIHAGIPYVGVSAGTNVACPTMMTTNDMPIVEPRSFAALGLVPFQVNAHYYSGHNWVKGGDSLVEHFGETRDDRLREFHEINDTPVIGLYEAGVLVCDQSSVTLHDAPARIFRKGESPIDASPDTDLTQWVMTKQFGPT